MANVTDPFAEAVHGTNPQNLIEKITRLKIYDSLYWKEQCFGLTAETIIDKAVMLKYCGGIYGGNVKPTPFLCLTLKLLQLQPEKEIVYEFIKNEDFKYLRLLGAFYLRLVGRPIEVYHYLEPLYNDYRKFAYRSSTGWSIRHIDEFIDDLFHQELVCDITLPFLPKREKLESLGGLRPRRSALDEELDSSSDDDEGRMDEDMIAEAIAEEAEASKKRVEQQKVESTAGEEENNQVNTQSCSTVSESETTQASNMNKPDPSSLPSVGPLRPPTAVFSSESEPKQQDSESKSDGRLHERKRSSDKRNERRSEYRYRDDSRDRRSHRSRSRGCRDRRSRDRRRDSRRRSRDRRRRRSYSRSSSSSRSRSASRDRHQRRRSRSENRRENVRDRQQDSKANATVDPQELRRIAAAAREEDEKLYAESTTIEPKKFKHSSKRFDKVFGKKSSAPTVAPGSLRGDSSAPATDSVEYWNQMRAQMGLKKLDG